MQRTPAGRRRGVPRGGGVPLGRLGGQASAHRPAARRCQAPVAAGRHVEAPACRLPPGGGGVGRQPAARRPAPGRRAGAGRLVRIGGQVGGALPLGVECSPRQGPQFVAGGVRGHGRRAPVAPAPALARGGPRRQPRRPARPVPAQQQRRRRPAPPGPAPPSSGGEIDGQGLLPGPGEFSSGRLGGLHGPGPRAVSAWAISRGGIHAGLGELHLHADRGRLSVQRLGEGLAPPRRAGRRPPRCGPPGRQAGGVAVAHPGVARRALAGAVVVPAVAERASRAGTLRHVTSTVRAGAQVGGGGLRVHRRGSQRLPGCAGGPPTRATRSRV